MPNWCENSLEIVGKEEDVKECLRKISGVVEFDGKTENTALDFNRIEPYPEKYAEQDRKVRQQEADGVPYDKREKDGYNQGGYEWCHKNWGTKWNACNVCLTKHKGKSAFLDFETAWSPLEPIIKKLSEMFPNLKFKLKYWEGGSGFRGIFICANGGVITDKTYNYKGNRGG